METRLIFCNLGFQYFICVNHVKSVIPNNTRFAEQLRRQAKEDGVYINASQRKETKSLVCLQSGEVIGAALYPATVVKRFRQAVQEAHTITYPVAEQNRDEKHDHQSKAPLSMKGYESDEDEDEDLEEGE